MRGAKPSVYLVRSFTVSNTVLLPLSANKTALPIYYGTRSKRKAVLLSLLSGMAEPLGVLFVFAVGARSLTLRTVARLLAVVGGIMLGLSFFELLPQARELTSTPEAFRAVALGALAMTAILSGVHSFDLE